MDDLSTVVNQYSSSSIRALETVLEDWDPTEDLSIVVPSIDLRDLRVVLMLNGEMSLVLDLERCQDT